MALQVTHKFISPKVEQADPSLVGPNEWNASHLVTATNQLIIASDYNFVPIQPGGSLTGGIANTVTLANVPIGVNGTDTNHYIYISGGTGAAEAVKITGGTAISGGTNQTITFKPINNHSGAWIISSATAGVQEAHNSGVGIVFILAGTYNWYGPFWSNGNATIIGAGQNATILQYNNTTLPMFDIERDIFNLKWLTLQQMGTPVSGNMGIFTASPASNIPGALCSDAVLEDLYVFGFYNGIYLHGGSSTICLNRISVNNSISDAIVNRSAQGYWSNIVLVSNAGNAITIMATASGSGGGPAFMTGIQTYNNGGWGLHSTVGVEISGNGSFFNNDYQGEVYVTGSPTLAGWIADVNIQFAGQSISFGTNTSAPGIFIDSGAGSVSISNMQMFNTQGIGVKILSAGTSLEDSIIVGPGVGNVSGNLYAFSSSAQSVILNNNNLGGPVLISGSNSVICSNVIGASSLLTALHVAAGGNMIIRDNAITQSGGGTALQIDTGVTYLPGNNLVVGTATNNGSASIYSVSLS